ncbi:MAG: thioredoxin family protein [Oligoflexus sp.]
MALMHSEDMALGTLAPDFQLPDAHGHVYSLKEQRGAKGTLVIFMCNHCPYVKHIAPVLSPLGRAWQDEGISLIGINSNDWSRYPDDSPEKMIEESRHWEYPFFYLIDEDQSVARSYHAVCTPDIYLFDRDLKLFYHGEFDNTRPGQGQATGSCLQDAIKRLVNRQEPPPEQKPAVGCSIKWKPS